jgi:integrase
MAAPTSGKEKLPMVEATSTFSEASDAWLAWATSRNRKPIRPSSVPSIKSALSKWINPQIGALPLAKVHSGSVKHLVTKMHDGGLTPKTINTYINLIKSVVGSVLDEETGEPVYPRKWNSSVLDLPIVENQKQPCLTAEEVKDLLLLSTATWERMLYLLLASTGLRIGEALALEAADVINGGRTLRVCQQVNRWGKIVKHTKTRAGMREIDLHPDITEQLLEFVGQRNGLLFPSRDNTPQLSANVQKRRLKKYTKKGWHSFRRYRNTHLRETNCLPDLIVFWMGHSAKGSMTELYSKLSSNLPLRLAEAERVGLGFDASTQSLGGLGPMRIPVAPSARRSIRAHD